MIQDVKNAVPAIDFGFGNLTKVAVTGEEVTVWLQTLYNQDAYTFALQTAGTVTKISNYEYRVAFAQAGSHPLQVVVSTIGKTKSLASNILNLNVTDNG